jgi:Flp pilus assembly protein TadG
LRSSTSGNATLLVALSMPALIGATGFAVDTAQWYTWKRELQFATDQAAIAGAWAMTDSNTQSTYQDRATQQYNYNLAVTTNFASAPTIRLQDYNGGNSNSVVVLASATKMLPFSSLITGTPTTVSVTSQAQFQKGVLVTSCMVATNATESGAVNIGGNSVITAGCGMAALSTSPTAITVSGQPQVSVGTISANGGIDPYLAASNTIQQNLGDALSDPYKGLTTPVPVPNASQGTAGGACTGTGQNKIAALGPGTYSDFTLKCDTTMQPGVYVIDGGTLDVAAQYSLQGSDVMFVLINGAGIKINGGAAINLTGISATTLETQSNITDPTEAGKLENMLVFEDSSSQGNTGNVINGNASTVLNGTVYLPKSNLSFEGTASVTSSCLELAADTLTITGTANMTNFCPANSTTSTVVGSTNGSVKLVA